MIRDRAPFMLRGCNSCEDLGGFYKEIQSMRDLSPVCDTCRPAAPFTLDAGITWLA